MAGKKASSAGASAGTHPGDLGLSLWRISFFMLMNFHWNHSIAHAPLPAGNAMHFFGYDQFRWVPPLMPRSADAVQFNKQLGSALTFMAAAGVAFPLSALAYTALAARHLLASVTHFTNHDYLFVLLSTLTAFSGAGRTFSVDALAASLLGWTHSSVSGQPQQRGARLVVVLLRFQCAVVYLYAALWKCHPDWVGGLCCRSIFLLLEQQGAARGVPWAALEASAPWVFAAVGVGGLCLDAAMFASLTFVRPSRRVLPFVLAFHLAFHGFTAFAMAQRIGYIFPATMVCAELLLAPLDEAGDACLLAWLRRLAAADPSLRAGRAPRALALAWVAVQLWLPARMPLVSGGEFVRNAEGYRWSWTMMLHFTSHLLQFDVPGPPEAPRGAPPAGARPPAQALKVHMPLMYFVPSCDGRGVMPRWAYMPETERDHEDARTFPLDDLFSGRHAAALRLYPRHQPKVVGGMARLLQSVCQSRVSITGVVFVQVNLFGAHARLVDPTVDLAAAERALGRRSLAQTLRDVVLDTAPAGHEHVLRRVGAGVTRREERARLDDARNASGGGQPWLLLDRAPCLLAQPLWLRPLAAARLWLRVHRAPCVLAVHGCNGPHPVNGNFRRPPQCMPLARLAQGEATTLLLAYALEVSLECAAPPAHKCGDAAQAEDVHIALAALPEPNPGGGGGGGSGGGGGAGRGGAVQRATAAPKAGARTPTPGGMAAGTRPKREWSVNAGGQATTADAFGARTKDELGFLAQQRPGEIPMHFAKPLEGWE